MLRVSRLGLNLKHMEIFKNGIQPGQGRPDHQVLAT
jgi:hypothetical protein